MCMFVCIKVGEQVIQNTVSYKVYNLHPQKMCTLTGGRCQQGQYNEVGMVNLVFKGQVTGNAAIGGYEHTETRKRRA